jgi:hypothetical protein
MMLVIQFPEHSHLVWILVFNFFKRKFDMKKIIYLILITPLILTNCSEEFLNLVPESSTVSGNFYQTKVQMEQALNGAYQMLRPTKVYAAYAMAEMRADNTHFFFNPSQRPGSEGNEEHIDLFVDGSLNPVNVDMWRSSYSGIARANSVLGHISEADITQQEAEMLEGQAKFLRALFYFDLVRYYGGVPLYINMVEDVSDSYLPRSSVADVYNIIVADLQDAITKLPVPTFPQNGRATQSSARMLLAEVYLTQKKFSLAENELRIITQMGHSLLPDYASVFDLSNKNSVESIFEVQFMEGNQGQQSNFYAFLPYTDDLSLITGVNAANPALPSGFNNPTGDLISAYEPNDKRLDASIGIAECTSLGIAYFIIDKVKSSVGYTTPPDKVDFAFIKKYFHNHSNENNQDDNFPVYRYSDVLLSLAEALNEQNKSSQALPYLNQVRSRAGLPDVTETAQALLREIIAHERRVELAFENKRWFDLLRTGKAIEVMTAHGTYIKAVHGDQGYLPANSYNVTTERLIYPIPFRDVQIGNLEQNPGYD